MASRQKIISALTLLSLSLFYTNSVYSAESTSTPSNSTSNKNKVKYKADSVSYEKGPKIATLKGKVEIEVEYNAVDNSGKPETVQIYGEQIDIDLDKRVVSTDQKFKITTKKDIKGKLRNIEIVGKKFDFAIDIKRLNAAYSSIEFEADAENQKVFLSGDEITIYNNGERINAVHGDVTTCDHIDKTITPHYNIKADNIDYLGDDRILTWNSSIYINGNKTYWYPFFYLPLKSNGLDFNLDAGKNEAEGVFVNFKNYYKLNDFHDGTLYFRAMEKKWLGLGIEHTWLANPTSQTYLFGYGNLLNSDYFISPKPGIKESSIPVFEDHEIYVEHRQWLPFLPYAQTDFTYNKRNFYNVNSFLSPKDSFSKYGISFRDNEIFQPLSGLSIGLSPSLNAEYEERIGASIDQQSGITTIANKNKVLTLRSDNKINFNDLNFNLGANFTNTIRDDVFDNTTANTSNNVLNKSFFKSVDNINLDGNLGVNYSNILPGLSFTGNSRYVNTDLRNFRKPDTPTLPSIQNFDPNQINQSLNTTATLSQELNWGRLNLTVENNNDFLEDDINFRDAYGRLIPVANLNEEQKKKRDTAIERRKSKSYINKLPQLDLNFNPFFSEYLPVNLSGSVARLLESTTYPKDSSTGLLDLVKTAVKMDIGSKDLDLGLGNKVNLGGTGYEQNFYQTQDAQYKFTSQFNYRNDLNKYFVPSLNYRKIITDDANNTPFSNDRFSRDKQDQLTGSLNIGNIPEFTLSLNNIGIDYMNKRYFDPNINLTSDFIAGLRFQLSAQTSYRLNNITKQSLTRPNTDKYTNQNIYEDRNKLRYDLARLSDADFSEMYLGFSKSQVTQDLAKLNDEQLKNKYSIDKRLYDVDGKNVIDNNELQETDIGRFQLAGSKFNPLTLTIGLATPWEFNSESDFGKEKDIPWGFATALSTNYDFQGEDYYKPKKVYGVLQPLTDFQRNANFLKRFTGNTTLSNLFVIGGNWQTHTVIYLDLSLIPPEDVAEGRQPVQTNKPFLPFNTSISIKKDLHDFILSFDFQNQYVPQYNKQDFMFSINLELTAFPLSLKDLANQATGQLNNARNISQQFN